MACGCKDIENDKLIIEEIQRRKLQQSMNEEFIGPDEVRLWEGKLEEIALAFDTDAIKSIVRTPIGWEVTFIGYYQ